MQFYHIACGYMQNTLEFVKNSSLYTDWMMASLKFKPIVFLNAYWLIIHIVIAINIWLGQKLSSPPALIRSTNNQHSLGLAKCCYFPLINMIIGFKIGVYIKTCMRLMTGNPAGTCEASI